MALAILYAAIYRSFQQEYKVVIFYLVGFATTMLFWYKVKKGADPRAYLYVWIIILLSYAVFVWFKTGGIRGGGMGYFTGIMLAVIISTRNLRVPVIIFSVVVLIILVLMDEYLDHLLIWGTNPKMQYDYVILTCINLLIVSRLKSRFDNKMYESRCFETGLKEINRLIHKRNLPLDDQVLEYLHTGCRMMGLNFGFIAELSEGGEEKILGHLKYESFSRDFLENDQLKLARKVVLDDDTLTVSHSKSLFEKYVGEKVEDSSFIGVPLVVGDQKRGVLGFYEIEEKKEIQYYKIELIELLAREISHVLDVRYWKDSRKEIDHALMLSEERFKVIYDHSEIGISMCSSDGLVVMANKAQVELNSSEASDVIGYELLKFIHPDNKADDQEMFQALLDGAIDNYYQESCLIAKDGKVIDVGLTISGIRDQDGNIQYVLCMMNDISTRKSREQKINELNTELEEKIDMLKAVNAELESFSHSVSHDLSAPLIAIDQSTKNIRTEFGSEISGGAMNHLESISKNSSRMSALIEGLLAFSSVSHEKIHLSPVNVAELLDELLDDMGVEKNSFLTGGLPVILGERSLLRQVFHNLIDNALKFVNKGVQPIIEVGYEKMDSHFKFFVRDNGFGFDMKESKKIFDVFYRIHKDEYPGTGVGLATVKKIISKHQGEIWVESKPGEGSIFYFTIPRS